MSVPFIKITDVNNDPQETSNHSSFRRRSRSGSRASGSEYEPSTDAAPRDLQNITHDYSRQHSAPDNALIAADDRDRGRDQEQGWNKETSRTLILPDLTDYVSSPRSVSVDNRSAQRREEDEAQVQTRTISSHLGEPVSGSHVTRERRRSFNDIIFNIEHRKSIHEMTPKMRAQVSKFEGLLDDEISPSMESYAERDRQTLSSRNTSEMDHREDSSRNKEDMSRRRSSSRDFPETERRRRSSARDEPEMDRRRLSSNDVPETELRRSVDGDGEWKTPFNIDKPETGRRRSSTRDTEMERRPSKGNTIPEKKQRKSSRGEYMPGMERRRSSSREISEVDRRRSSSREVPEVYRRRSSSREVPEANRRRSSSREVPEADRRRSSSREVSEVYRRRSSSREFPEGDRRRSSSHMLQVDGRGSSSWGDVPYMGRRISSDGEEFRVLERRGSQEGRDLLGRRKSLKEKINGMEHRRSINQDIDDLQKRLSTQGSDSDGMDNDISLSSGPDALREQNPPQLQVQRYEDLLDEQDISDDTEVDDNFLKSIAPYLGYRKSISELEPYLEFQKEANILTGDVQAQVYLNEEGMKRSNSRKSSLHESTNFDRDTSMKQGPSLYEEMKLVDSNNDEVDSDLNKDTDNLQYIHDQLSTADSKSPRQKEEEGMEILASYDTSYELQQPTSNNETATESITTSEKVVDSEPRKSMSGEIFDFLVRRLSSTPIPSHKSVAATPEPEEDRMSPDAESEYQETYEQSNRRPSVVLNERWGQVSERRTSKSSSLQDTNSARGLLTGLDDLFSKNSDKNLENNSRKSSSAFLDSRWVPRAPATEMESSSSKNPETDTGTQSRKGSSAFLESRWTPRGSTSELDYHSQEGLDDKTDYMPSNVLDARIELSANSNIAQPNNQLPEQGETDPQDDDSETEVVLDSTVSVEPRSSFSTLMYDFLARRVSGVIDTELVTGSSETSDVNININSDDNTPRRSSVFLDSRWSPRGSTAGLENRSPRGSTAGLENRSRTGSTAGLDNHSRSGSTAGFDGLENRSPRGSTTGLENSSPRSSTAGLENRSPRGSTTELETLTPRGSNAGFENRSPRGSTAGLQTLSARGSTAGLDTQSPRGSIDAIENTSTGYSKDGFDIGSTRASDAGVDLDLTVDNTPRRSSVFLDSRWSPRGSTAGLENRSRTGSTAGQENRSRIGSTAGLETLSPRGSTAGQENRSRIGSTAGLENRSRTGSTAGLENRSRTGSTAGLENRSRTGSTAGLDNHSRSGSTAGFDGLENRSPRGSTTGLENSSPRSSIAGLENRSPRGSTTELETLTPRGSNAGFENRSPRGSTAGLQTLSARGSTAGLDTQSPRGSIDAIENTSTGYSKDGFDIGSTRASDAGVDLDLTVDNTPRRSSVFLDSRWSPRGSTAGLENRSRTGSTAGLENRSRTGSTAGLENRSRSGSTAGFDGFENRSPRGSTAGLENRSPRSSTAGLENRSPRGSTAGLENRSRTGSTAGLETLSPRGSTAGLENRSRTGSTAGLENRSRTGSTAGLENRSRTGSTAGLENRSRTGSTAGLKNRSRTGSTDGLENRLRTGSTAGLENRSRTGSTAGLENRSRTGSTAGLETLSPRGSTAGLENRSRTGSTAGLENRSRTGSTAGFDGLENRSPRGSTAGLENRSRTGSTAGLENRSRTGSTAGLETLSPRGSTAGLENRSRTGSTAGFDGLENRSPRGSTAGFDGLENRSRTGSTFGFENRSPRGSTAGLENHSPRGSTAGLENRRRTPRGSADEIYFVGTVQGSVSDPPVITLESPMDTDINLCDDTNTPNLQTRKSLFEQTASIEPQVSKQPRLSIGRDMFNALVRRFSGIDLEEPVQELLLDHQKSIHHTTSLISTSLDPSAKSEAQNREDDELSVSDGTESSLDVTWTVTEPDPSETSTPTLRGSPDGGYASEFIRDGTASSLVTSDALNSISMYPDKFIKNIGRDSVAESRTEDPTFEIDDPRCEVIEEYYLLDQATGELYPYKPSLTELLGAFSRRVLGRLRFGKVEEVEERELPLPPSLKINGEILDQQPSPIDEQLMQAVNKLDGTKGWTTMDSITLDKKKKPLDSLEAVTFCGCGFLGIYLVGAATCLQQHRPHLLQGRLGGSSVGSLIATCIVCDVPLQVVRDSLLKTAKASRQYLFGPLNPTFQLEEPLMRNLLELLPEDAHIRASGRLFLSLTRVTSLSNEVVSEYETRDELLRAVLCCCFLPGISGFSVPNFQGRRYIDGGMSNNIPLKSPTTLSINAFSGGFDICPSNDNTFYGPTSAFNQTVNMSNENLRRFYEALLPPEPEKLDQYYTMGYEDTIKYLS
ncbi:hypothetical protein Pcinc_022661 [Petrolisthes cinctipes]|uniref:PNPLA domain-containing protein n=1 Tax=Petrolisthes cinctipes TaxID=88211 RepID=A0AAE1FF73_PETCI|nr:hypothetical protein Pcinc_022661 [Petrolisthes cinctipes]